VNEWEWNLLEDKQALDQVLINGIMVRAGDRVRLNPRDGGDILDIALRGQLATVESLEEDYEGAQHVCVVLDADPGRDLGMMRQPGHRFFFTPAEIELVDKSEWDGSAHGTRHKKLSILVAGIGNIFLGDDGFGVEVARRLLTKTQPQGVRVVDFGIRGFDLAYALQDGYDTSILIDAYPHGKLPGTISVMELDLDNIAAAQGGFVQPHAMNPVNVLLMAKSMNGSLKRVLLVGCEPQDLGGDEGHMGLSKPVEAALDQAVKTIEDIVSQVFAQKMQDDGA
jgi:hydrogenase maturation protease